MLEPLAIIKTLGLLHTCTLAEIALMCMNQTRSFFQGPCLYGRPTCSLVVVAKLLLIKELFSVKAYLLCIIRLPPLDHTNDEILTAWWVTFRVKPDGRRGLKKDYLSLFLCQFFFFFAPSILLHYFYFFHRHFSVVLRTNDDHDGRRKTTNNR